MASAPTSQSMNRSEATNDPASKENQTEDVDIHITTLTPELFPEARLVENAFIGHNKGCCFGLLRYSWCPTQQSDFDAIYLKDVTRRETYGVAISSNRTSDGSNKVVGICKGRRHDQEANFDENMMYNPKEGEFYIDALSVLAETRGKGVGTKLLQWAEEVAREKGDTKLVLGVMEGNPAERLYTRFGFVEVERDPCCV
ncbi:MAG: hypothetical protein SGARI_006286, partial [Bacillariaceae sp.]